MYKLDIVSFSILYWTWGVYTYTYHILYNMVIYFDVRAPTYYEWCGPNTDIYTDDLTRLVLSFYSLLLSIIVSFTTLVFMVCHACFASTTNVNLVIGKNCVWYFMLDVTGK